MKPQTQTDAARAALAYLDGVLFALVPDEHRRQLVHDGLVEYLCQVERDAYAAALESWGDLVAVVEVSMNGSQES